MSERTFRAIVAAVLVGALALALVVAFAVLQPPSPGPAPTPRPTSTAPPTPVQTPTPTPQFVFTDVGVTSVGSVPRGGASGPTLVLRFVEPTIDAIPNAAGSFTLTLTDSAGAGGTLSFTGTPLLDAPGSLGVSAQLNGGNVLRISIVASDTLNIEPIRVTGLGIKASPDAALGPIDATLGTFSGSFAGGVANQVLSTPGTVVAGP